MVAGYHDGVTELWTGLTAFPTPPGSRSMPGRSPARFSAPPAIPYFRAAPPAPLRAGGWPAGPASLPALTGLEDRIVGLAAVPPGLTSVSENGEIFDWYLERPDAPHQLAGRLEPPLAAAFFSADGARWWRCGARWRTSLAESTCGGGRRRAGRPGGRGVHQRFRRPVTGERLPLAAAPPDVDTFTKSLPLLTGGSLGFSFDPPPFAFDPSGQRLAIRLKTRLADSPQQGGGLQPGRTAALGCRCPLPSPASARRLSPDGRWLAWASDAAVELWDLVAGRLGEPIAVSAGAAVAVAFGPDSRSIAFAELEQQPRFAGRIRWLDLATRRPLAEPIELPLESGHSWVVALAFEPAGGRLISRSYDQGLRLWDLRTRSARPLLGPETLEEPLSSQDLAMHPSRPLLAFGVGEGALGLLDLAAAEPALDLAFTAPAPISIVAFDPGGDLLAAGLMDGSIHFFSLAGRRAEEYP